MSAEEITVRPGEPADLPAVAEVFLASRAGAVPAMPPIVHTPDEVRAYVGSWGLGPDERRLWVAEDPDGAVVGFAELKGAWLDDLYVHPDAASQGIGSTLLDVTKSAQPDGLCLWVFESNAPARAFYARRGFVDLERTDGSANEEKAPDVKMAWPGADPVAFYRGLIDEVDDALADLLARRAALTRVVQDVKGTLERDAGREREIAARMALAAPELGADRLSRIVHAIITESLDAVE
jgi:GNAT superfamily N-acetyltransferase/chorismate mutase